MANDATDSTPGSPYSYSPLPDGSSVRLLRRLRRDQPGPMRFSLQARSLDDTDLEYHCLSYTWGNPFAHGNEFAEFYGAVDPLYGPDGSVPIVVDGRTLRVSRNLFAALETLPENAYLDYANRPTRSKGQTVAHGAAGKGRYSYLLRYAKQGVDLNVADENGQTPLHLAAGNGFDDCVELLCEAGALRAGKDKDGRTPEHLAMAAGHESTVLLLRGWKSRPDPEASSIRREENGPEELMWIDAICINQDDVDEKSAQVSMMDQIYSRASFVVGWLGPEDEHTEAGVRALDTISSHLSQFQKSAIEPFYGSRGKGYQDAGVPPVSGAEWDGLASIYQRQWFRRIWVVQEAVLPGALVVYCGRHVLSVHELGTVAESIRAAEARSGTTGSRNYVPPGDIAVPVEWNMAELFKWREMLYWARRGETEEERRRVREGITLARLVDTFRTFLASDARDKIYSLDGILNAFAEGRGKAADYRKGVASVYTGAARRIIREEGKLGILSSCSAKQQQQQQPGDRDRLPGWVPDFAVPGVGAVPGFAADGGVSFAGPRDDVPDDSPVLGVKGVRLGRIGQAGGRVGTAPGGKLMFDPSHLELALSLRDTMRCRAGEQKPVLTEILWRTLCMDTTAGAFFDASQFRRQAPDEMGRQFTVFMALMLLAGADEKVLEAVGLKAGQELEQHTIVHEPVRDPWEEGGGLAPALEHLDALLEHDGEKCLAPTRGEVLMLWDNLKYTLLRTTTARRDGLPLDFAVPPGVMGGTDRIVGRGLVNVDSPVYGKCREFGASYLMAYGGRQLVTVDGEGDGGSRYLGLAPVAARGEDEVWVLPGLNAPAVLRRVSVLGGVAEGLGEICPDGGAPRYLFVGIAYVHGMMDGEAIRGREGEMLDIDLI